MMALAELTKRLEQLLMCWQYSLQWYLLIVQLSWWLVNQRTSLLLSVWFHQPAYSNRMNRLIFALSIRWADLLLDRCVVIFFAFQAANRLSCQEWWQLNLVELMRSIAHANHYRMYPMRMLFAWKLFRVQWKMIFQDVHVVYRFLVPMFDVQRLAFAMILSLRLSHRLYLVAPMHPEPALIFAILEKPISKFCNSVKILQFFAFWTF